MSHVTSMNKMFRGATWFNKRIGLWDVSNVRSISNLFDTTCSPYPCVAIFDQDLNAWDVCLMTVIMLSPHKYINTHIPRTLVLPSQLSILHPENCVYFI